MLEYVDVLRASHAAAMDDAEKQDWLSKPW
jgi:hypothetical protein